MKIAFNLTLFVSAKPCGPCVIGEFSKIVRFTAVERCAINLYGAELVRSTINSICAQSSHIYVRVNQDVDFTLIGYFVKSFRWRYMVTQTAPTACLHILLFCFLLPFLRTFMPLLDNPPQPQSLVLPLAHATIYIVTFRIVWTGCGLGHGITA